MKKIFSCILAIIILGAMLSGCSNNDSKEMIKKAKNFSIPHEVSINPTKEDYGILAYNFLHYIQDNYPGRIAGTEKEKEMAVFILSALLNGGYSEKDISIQSFNITEAVPMMDESIKNKFEGGKQSNSSQNIKVVKKGESEKTIVVGAHYDSAGTHGVDDNGSGIAVALENALRMADTQTHYTICYIFFGSEENGMCGSREYVETLSEKEREDIVLMINIDSVLAGDYHYLYGGNVNEHGKVDRAEAVVKAYDIAKKLGLAIQLPPEGNIDYPYPTGRKQHIRSTNYMVYAPMGVCLF